MTLWAIVPVKPLRRGKSRLAGVLTEEERTFLNYNMLAATLKTLKSAPEIDRLLVISRDPAALSLAREFDALTVQEDGKSNLNTALQRATVVAQFYAAQRVLILPADLPLLDKSVVQSFIRLATRPPVIVIAPDRQGDGTNAMLLDPAGLIEYQYGPGSFQRHMDQAKKYKLRVEVCETQALALDLDLPEDLDTLRSMDSLGLNL